MVSIVHLRDPAANDEWFRSYRDSYDESACAQAGGVARHAQTPMNGRTVYIGGCAGTSTHCVCRGSRRRPEMATN